MTELQAGRELDDLINEKVFDREFAFTPYFSTNIISMWTLVEHFNGLGFGVSIDSYADGSSAVSVLKQREGDNCWSAIALVRGATAPLALCAAALQIVNSDPH